MYITVVYTNCCSTGILPDPVAETALLAPVPASAACVVACG